MYAWMSFSFPRIGVTVLDNSGGCGNGGWRSVVPTRGQIVGEEMSSDQAAFGKMTKYVDNGTSGASM